MRDEQELREMKLNRKSVVAGIVGLGLVGVLAGGAGIAAAAPGTTTATSTAPYGDGNMSEMAGGMSGMGVGMHGMASGQNSPVAAAASYLGLSETDLQKQLQAGKSLADIAKAQGKSVSGLEEAMVASVKNNLNASTALTASEKASILNQVKSNIDTMVRTTHEPGAGFGPMGERMMDAMNGPMDGMGH